MTSTGQDFTTYAGNDCKPRYTVRDASGVVIDLSAVTEIEWSARRSLDADVVLSKLKSLGQITFATTGTDGKFDVNILAANTASLSGYYMVEATITDAGGLVSTVSLGRMQVGRSPAWTYSGDPANSDRDAVRFYIQDTDASNPQFTDPEVDLLVSQYGNTYLAAAQGCRVLGSKYARKVSKRLGPLSISYSDISKQYLAMADTLQHQGEQTGVSMYIGGISLADMESVSANTDRVPQPFVRKQFDFPNQGLNSDSVDDGEQFS